MVKKKTAVIASVIIILAAGLFLRANALDWETFGYGEVEIKEAAESYAKGNFVNNFYLFDTPPFGKYLFAASILILGPTEIALRSIALIFGLLTILMTFFLARKLYGTEAGILAAAITAFSILQIQMSRYAQLETILAFFYVATAYFLWDTLNNRKYSLAFLGISLGLALATKFTSIIILAAVIVYVVYTKHAKAGRKPFSLTINSSILKAIVLAIIVFLIAWPFGFARLHTEANISVDYGSEVRSQQISADIPIMLLSFSRRVFTSVGDSPHNALSVPVLNYFLLFIVKESLLMIPLLAAGIYFMIKKPQKADALILIFLLTFLVLLAFQRTSISYRHIVPMVPFFTIIASRWITHVKKQRIFIGIVAIILFAQASLAAPSYALYFNPLKDPLGIPDSEFRFNEGMKETINYLKENCSSAYASNYYRIMIEPYYQNIQSNPPVIDENICIIKGNISDKFGADSYIRENNCGLAKTVSKNSVKLIEIYRC